jgi:thiol-disulfide isomerase/thioredoxin
LSVISVQLDSIEKVYRANQASPKIDSILPLLQAQYSIRDGQKKELIRNFIKNNSSSLACLVFIDNLEMDNEFSIYDQMDKGLYPKFGKNLFVKDFHTKVEAERVTSEGSIAPEISLADSTGKIIKLSTLRGKVVLIDFWASWCGPCRKDNPHNVELYKKYNSKGFEIYGVSLDRDREKWLEAIKKDGLTWTHVSDLQYWKSEGAKTYGINAIPATVLLDRDGKIIAKKLRGPSLDEKLKEIFGF